MVTVAPDIETSHLISAGSGSSTTTTDGSRHLCHRSSSSSSSSSRKATTAFGIVIGLVLIVFLSLSEEARFVLRRSISSNDTVKSSSSSSLASVPSQQESPTTISSSPSPPTTSPKTSTPTTITNDDNNNESGIDVVADMPLLQSATESPTILIATTIQPTSMSPSMTFIPSATTTQISTISPPTRHPTLVPVTQPQPPQRIHRNITLIVQLRGELGNQLSVLANARITQLIAETRYPHINIQLIGQHQYDTKWTRGRDDLVTCFPDAFQHFEFSGGSHDTSGEFKVVQKLQQSWLTDDEEKKLTNVRSFNFLDALLLQQEQNHSGIPQLPTVTSSSSKYSLPYLTATSFSWLDVLKNEGYYNVMRQWLIYNIQQPRCCSVSNRPDVNDIVFHFRNYAYELRWKPSLKSRFVEISPYAIANIAYQNYTRRHHHKVAITSRFDIGTSRYIQAFRKCGISAYYVTGQKSGTEGFCFLLQAQKETFGSYQSTYYRWASLLGNATLTRFYMIDPSPASTSNNDTTTAVASTDITNSTTVTNNSVVSAMFASHTVPLPLARTLETFQRGNRTFTIEVYRL